MPPEFRPGDAVLRAMIVDDEPHARTFIRSCLEGLPGVEVVAECAGGEEAIRALGSTVADVVFLDLSMPEVGGFDVIEGVGVDRMPPVVFITAHDEGAVRAFDVSAVDYLLKPVDQGRLARAIERVRERRDRGTTGDLANALAAALELHRSEPYATRIMVPTPRGRAFLSVDDIEWLEANGKHVRLHTDADVHEVRSTLTAVVGRLDPTRFVRVHRSSAVALGRVVEVQPWYGGDYIAIMRSGAHVRVSRTYRENILRTLS